MDHRLRWLLDLVLTGGWAWWELVRYRNAQLPPGTPVIPFPIDRVKRGVVAVLVSRMGMRDRVQRALGDRTTLCFVRTWSELEDVVMRTSPCTILADPLADLRGDPEWHIGMLSEAWGVPVVLYTEFTRETVRSSTLHNLAHKGIRHIIFYEFDDDAERFMAVLNWDRRPPPREPPLRAA